MNPGSWLLAPALTLLPSVALAQQTTDLEAGGLKPPEAVGGNSGANRPGEEATQTELSRADQQDSGRGLEWAWLNGEVGAEHLGLETLKGGLVDGERLASTGTGLLLGAGLGARFLGFTAGARFRVASFSDYRLWTLNAEFGLHVPLGSIEPYATLGAGYASLGGYPDDATAAGAKSANGFDVRAAAGLDVYLSNTFSVGGNLSGDLLFLSRDRSADAAASFYAEDGSSVGLGVALTAVVGLHF